MGDDKHKHDPEGMVRMAEEMDALADRLDRLDESRPDHADPGVFQPYVTDGVNAVVADAVSFVLRLRAAADRLRESAGIYVLDEDQNEREVTILDKMDERWSP